MLLGSRHLLLRALYPPTVSLEARPDPGLVVDRDVPRRSCSQPPAALNARRSSPPRANGARGSEPSEPVQVEPCLPSSCVVLTRGPPRLASWCRSRGDTSAAAPKVARRAKEYRRRGGRDRLDRLERVRRLWLVSAFPHPPPARLGRRLADLLTLSPCSSRGSSSIMVEGLLEPPGPILMPPRDLLDSALAARARQQPVSPPGSARSSAVALAVACGGSSTSCYQNSRGSRRGGTGS